MLIKNCKERFFTCSIVAGLVLLTTLYLPAFVTNCYAERDYILIGRPNPSTGPLASFGEATPWTDDLALEAINKDGGIFIKELGKKLPVKIKLVDTQSDPTKAGDAASKLILKDEVDMMLVLHTPDMVNPVSAMCERFEVPCISLDGPVKAWLSGGPYEWSYHVFWVEDTLAEVFTGIWEENADKHNKTVGMLWPNDADAKAFQPIFAKKAESLGYKVVDTGFFPYFMKDYSTIINLFKKEEVDIVCGVLIAPDFSNFWRQAKQQGFHPQMATIGKAIHFPASVYALGGDLPDRLIAENWWSPYHPFKSSIDGMTAQEICDKWTETTGKQWTAPIGFKYAGYEIVVDVLKRAGSLDKDKIHKAIEETDLDTMVGHVKFNDKHYSETPLAGAQWVRGTKFKWKEEIVYNAQHPEIPKTAEIQYPLPQ